MDQTHEKHEWETPELIAITEGDVRADQPDIAARNGGFASPV